MSEGLLGLGQRDVEMYSCQVRETVGTGWSEGCRDVLTCHRDVEMYSRVTGM